MSECLTHTALKMAPNRRMCNELVWELCLKIPTAETSERILLTARNMYAYLAPGFRKLIYRDAIAFLKALLNAEKMVRIQIDQVVQNNDSEPIVIHQKQSDDKFTLQTNHLHVQIGTGTMSLRVVCWISNEDGLIENTHLLYFLSLIAPLLQPIELQLENNRSHIPIDVLAHFLNTQSDWIDSIALWSDKFISEPILYGALSKYNKLKIDGDISPANVPKLVHWLTSNNNNGQPKYLFNWAINGQTRLIKKLKKQFVRAKSISRFVVRLRVREKQFNEFTLRNELTGERLELRLNNIVNGCWYIHALSRFPNNGLDDNENDFAELDTFMTRIYLC